MGNNSIEGLIRETVHEELEGAREEEREALEETERETEAERHEARHLAHEAALTDVRTTAREEASRQTEELRTWISGELTTLREGLTSHEHRSESMTPEHSVSEVEVQMMEPPEPETPSPALEGGGEPEHKSRQMHRRILRKVNRVF